MSEQTQSDVIVESSPQVEAETHKTVEAVENQEAKEPEQTETTEDDETYQHEQQEVYDPMIEQNEQEIEQIPIEQDIDLSQLNLPDVVQQNEVQ